MNTHLRTLALLAVSAFPLAATQFYVTPNGSPAGDGSQNQPWDLQTALNQPAAVQPGDILWLRDGTYRLDNAPTLFTSRLAGASNLPITVRQYPGERATVDGGIQQTAGGWVNYWGFEITDSYTNRTTAQSGSSPTTFTVSVGGTNLDLAVSGFDLRAPNCKLINLVLHDNIGGGIGIDALAQNTEVYGCLAYYNGWQGGDQGHGDGVLCQNAAPGAAIIYDSLCYANYGLGMELGGSDNGTTAVDYDVEGNAIFLNGDIARQRQENFVLGALAAELQNPVIVSNCVYDTQGNSSDTILGSEGGSVNALVADNYFRTGVEFGTNQQMTLTNNTFLAGTISLNQAGYSNNFYLSTSPTNNFVMVRPNQYEPGRANIILCNWQGLANAAVDVSRFLPVGSGYEVRNAQDFFGTPVLSGTYTGGDLALPMTGLTAAQPISAPAPASTAPAFAAFVLLPVASDTNLDLTLGLLADLTFDESNGKLFQDASGNSNTATLVVGDYATPATNHIPGEIGPGALYLNGTGIYGTGDFAALSSTNQLDIGTDSFTLSVWMKTTNQSDAVILGKYNNAGLESGYLLALDGASNSGKLRLRLSDGSNNPKGPGARTFKGNQSVNGGNWHHIAVLVDRTNSATSFYIDGTLSSTVLGDNSGNLSSGVPFALGRGNGPYGGWFQGALDELRVYDRALSPAEILSLAQPSTPTPSQTNGQFIPFEAESGTLVVPATVYTQAISGVTYVCTPRAGQGSVSFQFNLSTTATCVVWCRLLATNYNSDSVFVSMDGGAQDVFDMAQGRWSTNWQWTVLNGRNNTGIPLTLDPRTFNLSAGSHTLSFAGREPFAAIDKILITDDMQYTPPGGQTPAPTRAELLSSIDRPEPLLLNRNIQIQFSPLTGAYYLIEATTDFQQWQTLTNGIASGSGAVVFTDQPTASQPRRFYRCRPD